MNYIELIGPPGAGKSTIYKEVMEDNRIFGGTNEDAVSRTLKNLGVPYGYLPKKLRMVLNEAIIEYRLGNRAFVEFVESNLEYLRLMADAAECASHHELRIIEMLKRSAERYQIGISTKRDDEILCLESDGLCQKPGSVMIRSIQDVTPFLTRYFEVVPIPDALFHINAPPEVCLHRQVERRNVAGVPGTEQQELNAIYSNLADFVDNNTACDVIRVDNTRSLRESVSDVLSRLD